MRSPYKRTADRTAARGRGCGPLTSGSLTTDRSIWWQRRCRRSHRRGRTPRSNGCCCKSRSSTTARSRRLQHSTTCATQFSYMLSSIQRSTAHNVRAQPRTAEKPCAEAATDSSANAEAIGYMQRLVRLHPSARPAWKSSQVAVRIARQPALAACSFPRRAAPDLHAAAQRSVSQQVTAQFLAELRLGCNTAQHVATRYSMWQQVQHITTSCNR